MTKSFASIAAAIVLPGAALLALPSMGAQTAPAIVAPVACGDSQMPSSDDEIDDDAVQIAADLSAEGYTVSGVEDFGGCVRAYMKAADGQTQMVYFTRSPLRQILTSR